MGSVGRRGLGSRGVRGADDGLIARLRRVLLAAFLSIGCATNPVTGENQIILMSTEDEKQIDAEAATQVEAQIGLVRDPELEA